MPVIKDAIDSFLYFSGTDLLFIKGPALKEIFYFYL